MCKVQMLRALVKQRLTAAAEEIFGLFERTIAEYEEELSASKEENERQRRLLDAVFNPQLRLQRADVQQLLVVKEEVPPEQQDWRSSLDQEDQEDPEPPHIKEDQEGPEPPHIKEEQEELWTSQDGEQLQGLEEAGIMFSFTPVKSEDDEEEAQSSQLHQILTEQMETDADGEDCGGPEPDRNSDLERHLGPDRNLGPDRHLQLSSIGKASQCNTQETDHSGGGDVDSKETREPQSGLNSLNNDEVSVSESRCGAVEKPFRCSVCEKYFTLCGHLQTHMRIHTGEKPFSCSVCEKSFRSSGGLQTHMRIHTGEKPLNCSVCEKSFTHSQSLQTHMRIHTGEKTVSCSVCQKYFTHSQSFHRHMRIHTGEKPFNCSVCEKSFSRRGHLQRHMRIHTGEKPFSCSVCENSFIQSVDLQVHMRIHTGEKPFNCSVCGKSFRRSGHLQKHMITHMGEKTFNC